MKPITIHELRKQQYFLDHIRWDVTPKIFLSPQITEKDGAKTTIDTTFGFMLYVDIIEDKPALFIMQLLELMSKTVGYIDDVPEEMLHDVITTADKECVAGMYPLSEKLKKWLKEQLGLS